MKRLRPNSTHSNTWQKPNPKLARALQFPSNNVRPLCKWILLALSSCRAFLSHLICWHCFCASVFRRVRDCRASVRDKWGSRTFPSCGSQNVKVLLGGNPGFLFLKFHSSRHTFAGCKNHIPHGAVGHGFKEPSCHSFNVTFPSLPCSLHPLVPVPFAKDQFLCFRLAAFYFAL